ncbi:jg25691, partial [Pararge aegeria aegeria]
LPGNNKISFKLDPGADVNILPVHLFEKINSTNPIILSDTCARTESLNGFKSPVKGLAKMSIEVNNKTYLETFCIAGNENSMPILCRDACVRLNLVKRVLSVLKENKWNKEDLIKVNSNLFTGEQACILCFKIFNRD